MVAREGAQGCATQKWESWQSAYQPKRSERTCTYRSSVVGRTPWSAADAHVGFLDGLILLQKCGSRGTRADQGVRPTNSESLPL